MQYKIIVDKQSSSNPSNEKKEYIIDIEELRIKGDVYDSIVITKEEDYVMRRLELTKYHKLNVLKTAIKQPLQNLNIELFEGDNYIYLLDMTGNKFYAEYIVKNDFTDIYVTRSEMKSFISQTATQIELSVSQKLEGYSTTEETQAMIEVKADSIISEVSQTLTNYDNSTEVSSKITQMANEIKSIVSSSITSPNLLLNSDFSNNFDNWDVSTSGGVSGQIATLNNKTWLSILNSESGGDSYYRLIQTIKPFTANIKYTLSALIKMSYFDSDSNTSIYVKFQFFDTNNQNIANTEKTVTLSNTSSEQKLSITIETPENDNISYCKMFLQITPKFTNLYITNLQLEKGSVATDWNISQTEFYSMVQQKVNEIILEVGEKVGNDEIIARINMSPEAVGIQANKINLTANDILNLIAGNAINLTSKNITITSDAFKVDKNGKVTCSNIDITGGKIELTSSENNCNAIIKGNDSTCEIYGNSISILEDLNINIPASVYTSVDDGEGSIVIVKRTSGSSPTQTRVLASGIETPKLTQTSLKSKKKNIKKLKVNATELIKNADICLYNLKGEKAKSKKHIGLVIGDGYNCPEEVISEDGQGVEQYSMTSIAWKAIQEQQKIIESLNKRIEKLEAK